MKKLTLRKQTVASLDRAGLRAAGGGYVDYARRLTGIPGIPGIPGGGGTMTGINPSQGPGCDFGGGDDGNY